MAHHSGYFHFHCLSGNELDRFETSLLETVTWCSPRASLDRPRESLRSSALCPPELKPQLAGTEFEMPELLRSHRELSRVVRDLMERRSKMVSGLTNDLRRGDLAGGRLVIHSFLDSLADGVPPQETFDFLDYNDAPPWDTWVWYQISEMRPQEEPGRRDFLIAWIPPAFVQMVERAIDLSCSVSLEWLDAYKCP